MEVTLNIESPEGSRQAAVNEDHLTIGRGEAARIQINDRGLSRLHASIHREGDRIWILDEGSANGSYVNEQRVSPSGTPLTDGDVIRLGGNTTAVVRFARLGVNQTSVKTEASKSHSPVIIASALVITFLIGLTALGWHLINKRAEARREELAKLRNSQEASSRDLSGATAEASPSPFNTPSTDANPLTTPSVSATPFEAQTPDASVVTLYLRMPPADQLEFIDRRARHITRMMGNREYAFEPEVLGYIKTYVDAYARRVGNGSRAMWGEDMRLLFDRGIQYAPYIISSFNRENVPVVVGLYIPVIESEYRECLRSPVGALGLFQFMGATAEGYGVPASERCNAERMAPAAARYMKDRIKEFGTDAMSVALGIAGYNRSPDSVRRDLQQVIDSKNNERSFWTLLARKEELDHFFQRENVKYVPKFFAAAIVGETPSAFGLQIRKLSTYDQPQR
jgi:hypothetical protein